MNVLFLGPACPRIEAHLYELGHTVIRREEPLDMDFLQTYHFDFCISYRYQHILTQAMLDYLHDRVINLHISLLPWNRGSDPHLWSFLEDTPKGVTIHKMDAGLDTGDILLQREVLFNPTVETLKTTHAALSSTLEELFLDNAEALLAETLPARKQPAGGTCHRYRDKAAFLDLIEELWWDTPVRPLIGAAKRESLTLRLVRDDDIAFIFALVNDPGVRSISFHSEKISWKTHLAWFDRQIHENNPFYIISFDDKPCGYVRMQRDPQLPKYEYILTIAVTPGHRKKGIATAALRAACKQALAEQSVRKIWAMVKKDNIASHRLFIKTFWKEAGTQIVNGHAATCFVYPDYLE